VAAVAAVASKAGVPGRTASAPDDDGAANGGSGGGLMGRKALETHAVDTASAPDPHKSDGDRDGQGGKDKGYLIGFG